MAGMRSPTSGAGLSPRLWTWVQGTGHAASYSLAGKERASLAHFVVNAVASQHTGDFLIVVLVASADEFHPRSGLPRENFRMCFRTRVATCADEKI
jgi:hypothetical protein